MVFDLDGTLADLSHRLHYIRSMPKDWDSFFEHCINDSPIHEIIDLNNMFYEKYNWIEVWSGRSDVTRDVTIKWLEINGVKYDVLRMRKKRDHRADDVIKEEMLHALPRDMWPNMAFDDRDRVVAMWRRNGIRCLQVAPGDF